MAIYKLGELVKIISGSKPLSNNGVQYPIVGSGGIFGKTNKFKYDGPSFTLPRKGTMKIFWYDTPIWNVDTAFLVGDVNDKVANKKYLYYHLKSNENWKKLVTGSTRPSTRITDWRDFSIELPSLKDQEKIIDIIEPLENAENTIDYLDELIVNVEDILICKIDNAEKIINTRDNFIKIKSQKKKSEELIPVSIGYAGFGKKHGKVAKQSKVVNQYDFAIGLISKRIPIAYNFSDKELGISTAYYCFESKIPIINFYFYKHLTNDWEQYVKRTSRQGQGFEKDIYLNEKILLPRIESFMEYQNIFNLLVNLKLKVKKMKIKEIKEKVIKGLL